MGYPVERQIRDGLNPRKKSVSWFKSWKFIILSMIALIGLICVTSFLYQVNHFNSNVSINDIEVGGLNTEEALERLQSSVLKNEFILETKK